MHGSEQPLSIPYEPYDDMPHGPTYSNRMHWSKYVNWDGGTGARRVVGATIRCPGR